MRAPVGESGRRAAVRHLLLQLGEDARLRRVRDAKVLGESEKKKGNKQVPVWIASSTREKRKEQIILSYKARVRSEKVPSSI